MKNYQCLFIFLFMPTLSQGQQKGKTYKVYYSYSEPHIFKDKQFNDPVKMKINYNGKDSSEEVIQPNIFIENFDLETSFFIMANNHESKTILHDDRDQVNDAESGMKIKLKGPDTLYYKDRNWTYIKNEGEAKLPVVKMKVKATEEFKDILGYHCRKYDCTDTSGKKYIIWATGQLPNTLLPFTGLEKFEGGILETYAEGRKAHTKAEKIIVLPNQ